MIEILLAAYNGEVYIGQQIESILNQTNSDWHLTVQDDGSSDRTVQIVKGYQAAYPEKITLRINSKNLGGARYNFYDMLLKASGDYVMTCDHDDIWLPDKIEKTFQKMRDLELLYGKEIPLLVHTDLRVVDSNLQLLAESMFYQQNLGTERKTLPELLVQNNITGCTMMVNHSLLTFLSPQYPANLIMHDWWLGLIAAAFGEIGFVPEPTILYRQHGGNEVGAKNVRTLGYNAKRAAKFASARKTLTDTYLQAGDFARQFKERLTPYQFELVQAYADMGEKGKLKRLKTLRKYGLWKNGFSRRLGQILYS